jgi:cytochrome d ubiquinol oxidase subunit I
MVGAVVLMILLALLGLLFLMRNTLEKRTWFLKIALAAIALPYIANSTGWILTEVGRQPWIVNGLMKTEAGVSPIAAGNVWTSVIAFTLVYGILAAVDVFLLVKYARGGETGTTEISPEPDLVTAY